jgi:hypothetical protein
VRVGGSPRDFCDWRRGSPVAAFRSTCSPESHHGEEEAEEVLTMSARVTVSRNFKSIVDLASVDEAIMREVGLQAREMIVRRTMQQRGVDGPFAPLSEDYAKRKREELGSAKADLTVSGNMLNDLDIVDVTANTVTLGFKK